jgi:hypothetical protein
VNETTIPKVSSETQQLLDVAEAVAKGASERWDELSSLAEQRQKAAAQKHSEYLHQIDLQPADFRSENQAVVHSMDASFRAYGAALDLTLTSVEKKDVSLLVKAAEQLLEAAIALGPEVGAFQEALLAVGGSRFKVVNYFENLSRQYRARNLSPEIWQASCARYAEFYATGLSDLEYVEPEAAGVSVQRNGFTLAREAVLYLGTLKPEDADAYDTGLAKLSQGSRDIEGGVVQRVETLISTGPTDVPAANIVINAAEGLMRKKLDAGPLKEAATRYKQLLREDLVDLDNVLAAEKESQESSMAEELPKLKAAMEEMSDCLNGLIQYADDQSMSIEVIDGLLGNFEDAATRLRASTKVIKEYIESSGKLACPHCGASNPPGARSCEKCQRAIPQRVGIEGHGAQLSSLQVMEGGSSSDEAGPVMTEGMSRLFGACDDFFKGKVTKEHALDVVSEFDEQTRPMEDRLQPLRLPDFASALATPQEREEALEAQELGQEIYGSARDGVASCLQGLKIIREAVEQEDQNLLRSGASAYWEGVQLIFNAKRLTKVVEAKSVALDQKAGSPAASRNHHANETSPEESEAEDYPSDLA